jgi:hypothetical protein
MPIPLRFGPVLTGCIVLPSASRGTAETWLPQFFAALAEEAVAGLALIRSIEQDWRTARVAVAGRRRDSRAASRSTF